MAKSDHQSPFHGAVMVAPMVRVSSLAFRVFAARCGADVVFSEELVAAKLRKAQREVVTHAIPPDYDSSSGSLPMLTSDMAKAAASSLKQVSVVEFVVYEPFKKHMKRTIVFSTLLRVADEDDRPRPLVVAQLGAADPATAAAAAQVICGDVDGIDVNMGCPKKFSVDNGMGAALMCDPERAGAILAAIDKAVNSEEQQMRRRASHRRVWLSFKTRVFANVSDSVQQLVTVLSHCPNTHIHAITLHARTRDQRSETAPLRDHAEAIVSACVEQYSTLFQRTCWVYNGSVLSRADWRDYVPTDAGVRDGLPAAAALSTRVGSGDCDFDTLATQTIQHRPRCFCGALIARAAMWDPTVLDATGPRAGPSFTDSSCSVHDICAVYRRLLAVHAWYRTNFGYVKYHFTRSFQEFPSAKAIHAKLQQAHSYREVAIAIGYQDEEVLALFTAIAAACEEQMLKSDGANDSAADGGAAGAVDAATSAVSRPPVDELSSRPEKIRRTEMPPPCGRDSCATAVDDV